LLATPTDVATETAVAAAIAAPAAVAVTGASKGGKMQATQAMHAVQAIQARQARHPVQEQAATASPFANWISSNPLDGVYLVLSVTQISSNNPFTLLSSNENKLHDDNFR
jgi:hypothetical protein